MTTPAKHPSGVIYQPPSSREEWCICQGGHAWLTLTRAEDSIVGKSKALAEKLDYSSLNVSNWVTLGFLGPLSTHM